MKWEGGGKKGRFVEKFWRKGMGGEVVEVGCCVEVCWCYNGGRGEGV